MLYIMCVVEKWKIVCIWPNGLVIPLLSLSVVYMYFYHIYYFDVFAKLLTETTCIYDCLDNPANWLIRPL